MRVEVDSHSIHQLLEQIRSTDSETVILYRVSLISTGIISGSLLCWKR